MLCLIFTKVFNKTISLNSRQMTHQEAETFLKNVDTQAVFWQQLHDEDRPTVSSNGGSTPLCLYNLILTRRDVQMYAKHNMKPHRGWKISQVKEYYGIKGNKQKIADQIEVLVNEFLPNPERKTL
jgi:hypothetical protein